MPIQNDGRAAHQRLDDQLVALLGVLDESVRCLVRYRARRVKWVLRTSFRSQVESGRTSSCSAESASSAGAYGVLVYHKTIYCSKVEHGRCEFRVHAVKHRGKTRGVTYDEIHVVRPRCYTTANYAACVDALVRTVRVRGALKN